MSIRRLACAALLASLFVLSPAAASAAPEGFSVNRFEPSERGSQWFVLESLDMRGTKRPAFGLIFDYAYRPLAIYESNGDVRAAVVNNIVTTHLGGSFILWERLRVAASMPLVLYTDGEAGTLRGVTYAPPSSSTTVGDLRLGVDGRLFGEFDGPITMALGARLWVPTGSPSSYTGDGGVRVGPRALVAGVIGSVAYAAQLGVTVRSAKADTFGDSPVGSELVYSVAGGFRTPDGRIVVGPELYGTTVLSDAFKTRASPLEILLGGHVSLVSGFRAGAGIGTGLVGGFGSPGVRALLSLEWAPDPAAAVKPIEGPPPETDTDGDGIPDHQDACLDVQGSRTNDPKTNGCADRDNDGILDPLDNCPFEAGPASNEPGRNGCPMKDTDKDGVPDHLDQCPEVFGDPKLKGCPSASQKDGDQDGISDAEDACPADAGQPDPDPKKNGCPKAFVRGDQIMMVAQPKFIGVSDKLDTSKQTEEILQAVVEVLKSHLEITKVTVEGHTDNRGDVRANKKLSADRAASVAAWLVAHGIEKGRIASTGYGIERPIDSNDTEAGRAANQRIEFHIEASGGAPPP